jgi:hypothetical protein
MNLRLQLSAVLSVILLSGCSAETVDMPQESAMSGDYEDDIMEDTILSVLRVLSYKKN